MLRGGRDEYGCGAVIEGRWCLVKSDGEHCTGCGWQWEGEGEGVGIVGLRGPYSGWRLRLW